MSPHPLRAPIVTALQTMDDWRGQLLDGLGALADLTRELEILPTAALLRIRDLQLEIRREPVRIAVVGEFSRGKSELINAAFLAGSGHRILPSSSGQTTLCPTEITAAGPTEVGLLLLPIATRSLEAPLALLRQTASAWQFLPVDAQTDGSWEPVLKHLTETQCVPLEEARRLLLCPPLDTRRKGDTSICPPCGAGRVTIPRWRHALLRLPHTLLAHGLSIIDTPGLNALGAEPELTLEIVGEADAVIFVLGIDTGVTQSDLTIWQTHLRHHAGQQQLVVLNKIDTLRDDLRTEAEIGIELGQQIDQTALRLDIDPIRVIPVSARKALVARLQHQSAQLEQSGILRLETTIAQTLIPAKRASITRRVQVEIVRLFTHQQQALEQRALQLYARIGESVTLREQGAAAPALVQEYGQRLAEVMAVATAFAERRETFVPAVDLCAYLRLEDFDADVAVIKSEMLSAWTTASIVQRFDRFFSHMLECFDQTDDQVAHFQWLLDRLQAEWTRTLQVTEPAILPYLVPSRRAELAALAETYTYFGTRMELAASTQGTLVRKTFLGAAARVRRFVAETRTALQDWQEACFVALRLQLDRHQADLQNHLDGTLASLQSYDHLEAHIRLLREQQADNRIRQARLLQVYQNLRSLLQAPVPASHEAFFPTGGLPMSTNLSNPKPSMVEMP